MYRNKISLPLLLFCFLLIGCTDQRKIEELGFVHTTSYDLINREEKGKQEDYLKVTISVPAMQGMKSTDRELLTTITKSSKEARIHLSKQTNKALVSGQLRNSLYGISLAKQGIWKHIDTFVRDPAIGPNVKITIVDGNAHDLLKKDYPQHTTTGKYIDRMLDKVSKNQIAPDTTLYKFSRDYYDDGIDPIAPIIRSTQNNVVVDGIALFNEDRYVGKVASKNSLIFAFIKGDFRRGEINLEVENKETGKKEIVLFSSLSSSRKVKVTPKKVAPFFIVDIEVNASGSILEYIGDYTLSEEEQLKKLEKSLSNHLSQRANELVKYMQKVKADSVGIGKHVRNSVSYKEWTKMKWDQVYPTIQINCHFHASIRDYGKFK